MDPLRAKFDLACTQYVEQMQAHPDVIGIVVAGSYMYADLDPNSDIDIHLILDPACTYRERGNTWINDVEIEYFMNPPQQIRAYFKAETKSPHTADMLAHGKMVFQRDPVVAELIAEANAIMDKEPPGLNEFKIEFAKYGLDDVYKDFQDSLLKNDGLAIELIGTTFINNCIDIFCLYHQVWRAKHKRLKQQLQALDPRFANHIKIALSFRQQPEVIDELRAYVEQLIGGIRPKEWKLRSDLDL